MILYASDGMRPDLVDKYVAEGAMPTYAELMPERREGRQRPASRRSRRTRASAGTRSATGTWPGEHGSMNNTYFRTGEGNFNNRTSFATTGALQADHIAQAAERAGKKVVSVEWVGARNLVPALQGPVVDFRNFFSNRGILLNYDLAGQPAGANAFGVSYQRVDLDPAVGLDERAGQLQPAEAGAAEAHEHGLPGGRQRRPLLRPLHLRLDQRRRDELQPRPRRRVDRRQERRPRGREPRCRRLGRHQGHAHGRPRRPDRGLLHEGDRDRPGPVQVPGLLRLDQPARTRRTTPCGAAGSAAFEETLQPRLPELDGGRLRAARGAASSTRTRTSSRA